MRRPQAIVVVLILLVVGVSCSALDERLGQANSGQHLTLAGSPLGVTTLDPALVRDVESAFLARQIFRGLVRLDNQLNPEPDLARSIDVSDDGTEYRFTLHDNAAFHDGTPIDADAVVRSFNRASNPHLESAEASIPPASTYFSDIVGIDDRISGDVDSIAGIEAIDRLTVRVQLKRPAVNFLYKLAGSPAAVVDVSTATGADWWRHPNGSGPFMVEEFRAGERLVLVPHDQYPGGVARLDSVTILFGSQAGQPLNLYEEGLIDVVNVPSWALDRVLSPRDPLHSDLVGTEELATTFIALNPTIAPFDDVNVRRMLASAIDRSKLAEVGFDGHVILAHGLIPPGIGDREWRANPYTHDLDSARRYARSYDHTDAPLTLYEPGGGIGSILKAVIDRDLGITIDVIDQSWPEFSERLSQRDLASFVLTWVVDFPDPENALAALLQSGSPDNYLAYSNPEFDRLVDEAATVGDEARRQQLYLEAQDLAVQDAVVIPLYHEMSYTLVNARVRGLTITEIGILSLENVWIEE